MTIMRRDILLLGACVAGYALSALGRPWAGIGLSVIALVLTLTGLARHERSSLLYRPRPVVTAFQVAPVFAIIVLTKLGAHDTRVLLTGGVVLTAYLAFLFYGVTAAALLLGRATSGIRRSDGRRVEFTRTDMPARYWCVVVMCAVGTAVSLASSEFLVALIRRMRV